MTMEKRMNPRSDRNNAVLPTALENREERPGAPAAGETIESLRAELAKVKAGIQSAMAVEPRPNDRHCLDCFNKGRDAAIRAITGA
jgi:hypothetical protein